MAMILDTLKMAEALRSGGFTEQQARTMISTFGDAASGAEIATRADVVDAASGLKTDFEVFKSEMKHDFEAFKSEMKYEFVAFKSEMKHDLLTMEQRLTIRMGGMLVVAVGVLAALAHFLR